MPQVTLKDICLCGTVQYEVIGDPQRFYHCHCSRCRKSSGTEHASNIMMTSATLVFSHGESRLRQFKPPEAKRFSRQFCAECGSPVARFILGWNAVVIPAGSLDDSVPIKPQARIYWDSRTDWTCDGDTLPRFPRGLPTCSQRPLRVARASSGHRGCRLNAPAQIFRWDCSSGSNAKADRPLRRQALNERSGRSVDDRLRWPAWAHRVGIVEVKTYQSLLRSPSVKTSFIGNGSSQRCGGWREAFLMLSPVAQWRLAARITARAPWNRNAAGLLGCRLSGHSGPGRSPGWPS